MSRFTVCLYREVFGLWRRRPKAWNSRSCFLRVLFPWRSTGNLVYLLGSRLLHLLSFLPCSLCSPSSFSFFLLLESFRSLEIPAVRPRFMIWARLCGKPLRSMLSCGFSFDFLFCMRMDFDWFCGFVWFCFSVDEEKGERWAEVISWEPRAFVYHNFLVFLFSRSWLRDLWFMFIHFSPNAICVWNSLINLVGACLYTLNASLGLHLL